MRRTHWTLGIGRWTLLLFLRCFAPAWADIPEPKTQNPEPSTSEPSVEFDEIHFKADKISGNLESHLHLRGNVRIIFREATIAADEADADLNTKVAIIRGSVLVREKGQDIHAEAIEFDIENRRWSATRARSMIFADPFRLGTVGPLFAETQKGEGSAERTTASHSRLTSCDLSEPHYEIRADEVTLIPNDKLVLKNVSFWLLGRKVFERKHYVIPLQPGVRRAGLRTPFVGHNEVEGFFLKNSFDYLATSGLLGTLFLDFMSRRGVGFGTQHRYNFADSLGQFYVYTVRDKSTGATQLDTRFRHQQRLFGDFIADVGFDSTRNNQFTAPGSSVRNVDLALQSASRRAYLSLRSERSESPFFGKTDSLTGQFSVQRAVVGRNTFLDFSADYRRSLIVLGEPRSEELTNRLQITRNSRLFDTILRFEKLQDLDHNTSPGDQFRNALDRVPEIAFLWSSARNQRKLMGLLPADAQLSFGDFREFGSNPDAPNGLRLRRTYFQLDFPGIGDEYVKRWGENTELGLGGTFRQSLYSNDTAQYVLDTRARLQRTFGERAGIVFDYLKQRPVGFTPFLFDVVVPYHSLDLGLFWQTGRLELEAPQTPAETSLTRKSLTPSATPLFSRERAETAQRFVTPKFRFNLSTGRDFENNAFRDLIWRAQFIPTRSFYTSLSAAYDFNEGEFRDMILRLRAGSQALAPFLTYPSYGGIYPYSYPGSPNYPGAAPPIYPYGNSAPYGGYNSPYGAPYGLTSPYAPRYVPADQPLFCSQEPQPEKGKRRSVFKRIGVNLAARFNPSTGQLGRVNTYLNWQLSDKWAIEWLGGYNGITKDLDFSQVRVTRDLHCFQAYLTADKFRREVRLDIALKAFPLFDTRFGVGGQGQLLSPSVGEIF